MNFDGASKGNLGKAGYGGIARNFVGSFLVEVVGPLGSQTSHYAEASAALNTLIISKNLNHDKLWLEGDSLNIIKCLKGEIEPSWSIENIILKAMETIASFKVIIIEDAFREKNMVANCRVNLGINSKSQTIWHGEDVNMSIKELLGKDRFTGKEGPHNYDN